MSYQARWQDGAEVAPGERDCAGRYEAIARDLRPSQGFSVLDIGANAGYFSKRLAEEFGASCLAVDKVRELVESPGVQVRRKYVRAHDLREIQYGEYDVTLLLSVLHHMSDWRDCLSAVVGFSAVTFVELADPREILPNAVSHPESIEMHRTVQAIGGIVINWSPGYDSRYSRALYAVGRLG